MDSQKTPIQRACDAAGGQNKLAALLGVTPPTVNEWVKGERPVPMMRCIEIEQITAGIGCRINAEELNTGIDWKVLRQFFKGAKDRAQRLPAKAREPHDFGAA